MKIIFSVLVILLMMAGFMFYKNNVVPNQLGVHNGQLAPVPSSPNAVSSQTGVVDKRVEPLAFQGDFQGSKDKILSILSSYPGATIVRDDGHYIHGVFSTSTIGFKDDVEFYFDEKANLIHFRSASRVGYSDMGMNHKRYAEIKKRYEGKE